MPWSPQSEMKWVCSRPLVLSPQMKKVPARIQKVLFPGRLGQDAETGRGKSSGPRAGRLHEGASLRLAEGSAGLKSRGWSRMKSVASAATHAGDEDRDHRVAPAMVLDHPGRDRQEDQLPVAVLAANMPTTSPRFGEPAVRDHRAQHQRGQPGAAAEHQAPQQEELPELRDCGGSTIATAMKLAARP
jgi:hypothetical protein